MMLNSSHVTVTVKPAAVLLMTSGSFDICEQVGENQNSILVQASSALITLFVLDVL